MSEQKKEYLANWRKQNKEKIRLDGITYRKKNKEKLKISTKNYREKNRDRINKNQRIRKKIVRSEVLMYYSKGVIQCACCGELIEQFLSIDHIQGRRKYGHKNRWGGTKLYMWLKRNNFPKGFRVLCMNCNHAIGKRNGDGICPHQKLKELDKRNEFRIPNIQK